jgi:hypothetical protein
MRRHLNFSDKLDVIYAASILGRALKKQQDRSHDPCWSVYFQHLQNALEALDQVWPHDDAEPE